MNTLNERHLLVIKLREEKTLTFKAIAESLGCSPCRASQIYRTAKRVQKWHEQKADGDPYYGLSTRAANCCNNAGLMNRAQIVAAISSGRLHPSNIAGCGNYGWGTHIEVHKWLGLPEPQRTRPRMCPHCGGRL